jgi:hypothetical protein
MYFYNINQLSYFAPFHHMKRWALHAFEGLGVFFYVLYSSLLHLRPSDSPVSEDAGIELRTVVTLSLVVRRAIHWARSHSENVYLCMIIRKKVTKNCTVCCSMFNQCGHFYVLYSTLLHLPPLRFYCVRVGIGSQKLLTTRQYHPVHLIWFVVAVW